MGQSESRNAQRQLRELQRIYSAAINSRSANYGIQISTTPRKNWWDSWSSMMQGVHKTSIDSLNDDNRNDQREIEILQDASTISDEDILRYKDAEDFYTEEQLKAFHNGNKDLAEYYRQ
jgi:hypothetical protein